MSAIEEQQSFDHLAIVHLKGYIASHKGPFRAENVRIYAQNNGLVTIQDRVWGSVMQRAKKMGLVIEDGYASVKNPKAHGAIVRQWRAA